MQEQTNLKIFGTNKESFDPKVLKKCFGAPWRMSAAQDVVREAVIQMQEAASSSNQAQVNIEVVCEPEAEKETPKVEEDLPPSLLDPRSEEEDRCRTTVSDVSDDSDETTVQFRSGEGR